jgi:exosortase E/protease (VPEID-CTERM system)
MSHSVPESILAPVNRLGWVARIAILCAVFLGEKTFLNLFVHFDLAQTTQGFGVVLRESQHLGFRFIVAFIAASALFTYVRGGEDLPAASAAINAAPLRLRWILPHLLLLAALVPLSYSLYLYVTADLSIAAASLLWVLIAVLAALAALCVMAPLPLWWRAARSLGDNWRFGAVAAVLGTGAMQLSQRLWEPTAALTFELVRHLLIPFLPDLMADSTDPAASILRTSRFAVQIGDTCSGLEGVSLIVAFSAAWLLFFRREYIFPRSLLLIPVGVIAIFGLNVLRLVALFLIGNAGFPEVAAYGFHSQAGWIAFIAVACGLVLLSRHSAWLNRNAQHGNESAVDNPTAVYLMPLLAILAAGAVSTALSSDFQYLYSLRVLAAAIILVRYRHRLRAIDWHWSWRAPVVGALVFLIWLVAAIFLIPRAAMPPKLAVMPFWPRGSWVVGRIVGAVVVVPIAEELAYRGFLMRRLIDADFESVPYQRVPWTALLATAVVFGMAHGTLWLPGIVAGVIFGLLVIRRGSLGESVVAHAVANALLVVAVLTGGQWQLW